MRTLKFSYCMELIFSEPVCRHQFTLRMLPHDDERQHITECGIQITPECELYHGTDAFGNCYVYGEVEQAHNRFQVEVEGTARIREGSVPIPVIQEELVRYRYSSKYTRFGDGLMSYYQTFPYQKGQDGFEYAVALLHKIYQDMEYVQGVTNVHTTAEEAVNSRQGVCQDYAHIMISLCRIADIPARYVVGMMQGEGYSHAWVEVCVNGCWYGMDPTNDRLVDDTYIKLSQGRDYQDCIVNRGVFCGTGTQTQHVKVVVT